MAASFEVPAQIIELLNKPIPSVLWHYTAYEGFLGILESQSIYATDVRFLNDAEEFVHAKKLIYTMAEETAKKVADEEQRKGLGDIIVKSLCDQVRWLFESGPLSTNTLQVFVACFCEHKDQLSQWRGYANASSGVSVGFDLGRFRELRKSGVFVFAPCIYDDDEKRKYLDLVLEDIVRSVLATQHLAYDASVANLNTNLPFEEWYKNDPTVSQAAEQLNSSLMKAAFCLLQIAALMKHSAFREEAEWRIVVPRLTGFSDQHHSVFFGSRSNTIIPRLGYDLPSGKESLKEIVTGPTSHPCAVNALEQILRQHEVTAAISKSLAPYRIESISTE